MLVTGIKNHLESVAGKALEKLRKQNSFVGEMIVFAITKRFKEGYD